MRRRSVIYRSSRTTIATWYVRAGIWARDTTWREARVVTELEGVAAELVAAGTPFTIDELTERVRARGTWRTRSKTPAATIESQLAVELKRHGTASRFILVAHRTYGLRAWTAAVPVPDAMERPAPLTFLEAARRVLEEQPSHEPVSYRTITQQAIAQGYVATGGLTPEATMYAQLVRDIDRRARRGDEPCFSAFPRGLFGLASWDQTDIVSLIARHNQAVKAELLAPVQGLSAEAFETLIAELLTKLGFDVEVSRFSGDGGIDVRGTLVIGGVIRTKMAVQVKHWQHNVQSPTVQQVRGALGAHEQGLIVTTSDFSAGARAEAIEIDRTPVALMNGSDLVSLLVEHEIGVQRASADLLDLGPLPFAPGGLSAGDPAAG